MKTYYDILEISRHASKEVLERAHKVLIKRYHPDLETDPKKRKEKEEYIKKINEAYAVLSDENKKREYDLKVFRDEPLVKETKDYTEEEIIDEKRADEIEQNRVDIEYTKIVNEELRKAQERINHEEQAIKENLRKYERAYLRSLGYTITEPTNWKRVGITTLVIITLIILLWLIYLIPPIKNSINSEIANKTPFGFILNIFKQFYVLIGNIFTSIFKKKEYITT